MLISKIIYNYKFLNFYPYWNIGIANIDNDLNVINVKWMKHKYKDRWFADPFIIEETDNSYIILVEEFMRDTRKGRIARLTVKKDDFSLINNEKILELRTHLSFPNNLIIGTDRFIYPENSSSGKSSYYSYNNIKIERLGTLCNIPIIDPVIFNYHNIWYLLATMGKNCNGNILHVFISDLPLSGYHHYQEIQFNDNIARRAGNVFIRNGKIYSPAQVCINDYGEAISIQELSINKDKVFLNERKRIYPPTLQYQHGFHTYNVFENKIIIDGYYYKHPKIIKFYRYLRGIQTI